MAETTPPPLTIELTPAQVALVRAALRLLLDAEDDVEAIRELKALLARLDGRGP